LHLSRHCQCTHRAPSRLAALSVPALKSSSHRSLGLYLVSVEFTPTGVNINSHQFTLVQQNRTLREQHTWCYGCTCGFHTHTHTHTHTQVHVFWSSDRALSTASWHTATILQLPQNGTQNPHDPPYIVPWWTAFNTSPTKGKLGGRDAYFLAIELGSPSALIGVRFTSVFAVCYACASTGDLR
jgi:hypothetical protein